MAGHGLLTRNNQGGGEGKGRKGRNDETAPASPYHSSRETLHCVSQFAPDRFRVLVRECSTARATTGGDMVIVRQGKDGTEEVQAGGRSGISEKMAGKAR